MRSLHVRLLVGFLAVLLLATFALYRTYLSITAPRIADMIVGSQAAQANEAAMALANGGVPAARDYIARLDATTQMVHHLADESGRDLSDGSDRASIVQRAWANRGRPFTEGEQAVFVTRSQDGAVHLITLAPIPFRASDFLLPGALIAAAVLLLFSLVVTDVVRPLRRLAEVVHRFGRGELDARSSVSRRDEIGQLATSFNEMAERLQALVTSERRLLQDVSHELRSPLTRLNIGIELLRTAADPQQAADRLQREASRLSDLVSTLLEVVRLEREPGSTPMAPLALAEVLADSVQGCATEAERRNVTIEVAGAAAGIVNGSAELLRRAFDNIIGNAARYAPAGTAVTVCCRKDGADYVIEVRDFGPGVRDDQLAKLGSAFYRADESRSADTGGVGLGLAIARRALHLHHGTMEIANGHPGLQVTMRLPLENAA